MSEASSNPLRPMRKSFACDECKRRKIRCSGGDRCANCVRDDKFCRYSSPSQKLASLQRHLRESEAIRRNMEAAWKRHLPNVDLETVLGSQPKTLDEPADTLRPLLMPDLMPTQLPPDAVSQSGTNTPVKDAAEDNMPDPPMEHVNADDFEFDESQDPERTIDGMAFLTCGAHKSGYTGPQSGIAALKFLQSLPPYPPVTYNASPLSGLDDEEALPDAASHTMAEKNRYIDYYFELYHPAYPILHEGTFRARPRDGSWTLLHNAVLAIGAFVSASSEKTGDLPFFREARKHLNMGILEKGSLCYVQALTLLANYLQKRNKPNAGFILMGTAFNMALAIGLHREFDIANTSPFTMEVRRRTWWTLFVFISGAQLALDRPAASLFGVNVRLPANLDDLELAVDMDRVPAESATPTVASCLIEQVKLAKIANMVHDELLTHRRPSYAKAMKMEECIRHWQSRLPFYFDPASVLEARLELPKRILLWRCLNLQIVLNRPFVFEAIATGTQLSVSVQPIRSCLVAADECAASICGFLGSLGSVRRGFAWYATAWLITASFVQATCLIYMPDHGLAAGWREALQGAVGCLQTLGSSLEIALRARDILQNVLDNKAVTSSVSPASMLNPATSPTLSRLRAMQEYAHIGMEQSANNNLSDMGIEDDLTWLARGQTGVDFLDAGGFMYGNGFNVL